MRAISRLMPTVRSAGSSPGSLALIFLFVLPPHLQADPIQVTYSTNGAVGATSLDGQPVVYWPNWPSGAQQPVNSPGIDGTPAISFQGISNGVLAAGQPFDLGQFVLGPMAPGTTTTYTDTPFQITFTEQTIGGEVPSPNATPIVIAGFLSGTVTAGQPLNLSEAFITWAFPPENGPPFATTLAPFRVGSLMDYLYISEGDDGQVIQGELNLVEIVPEPSSLAIFGLVGIVLVRCRRWPSSRHERAS